MRVVKVLGDAGHPAEDGDEGLRLAGHGRRLLRRAEARRHQRREVLQLRLSADGLIEQG